MIDPNPDPQQPQAPPEEPQTDAPEIVPDAPDQDQPGDTPTELPPLHA